jgi:hypothetical protein
MHSLVPLLFSGFSIFAQVWSKTTPSRLQGRQSTGTSVLAPPVDIGYGVYQGYYNETSQLNIYKGYVYQRMPAMDPLSLFSVVVRALNLADDGENSVCSASNWDAEMAKAAISCGKSKPDN